jgi:hypothetical protein
MGRVWIFDVIAFHLRALDKDLVCGQAEEDLEMAEQVYFVGKRTIAVSGLNL